MKIRKLVLPVAGQGTRLRPLTLTTPKNLIKLREKPILEYALDEAVQAGIEEVIVVVSPEHEARYESYFREARKKYPGLSFRAVVQSAPLGDGHAVLQARGYLGKEPFAVRFCDDIIVGDKPSLVSLIETFEREMMPTIFLERVPKEAVVRYGVVKAEPIKGKERIYKITGSVEKPKLEEAPSDLIIVGGYALTSEILEELQKMSGNIREEKDALRLNHVFMKLFGEGKHILGWEFPGVRLDCGTVEGLANAEEFLMALEDSEVAKL